MQGALAGIASIWVVIGVGWLVAHLGVVNDAGRRLISRLAFTVGSPALLLGMLARAPLGQIFSLTVVVSFLAMMAVGLVYLTLARFVFQASLEGTVLGWMSACYTNLANFGLPVALALLGDATWVAPMLLLQVAVVMPVCLALLDVSVARESGTRISPARYLTLPLRNPISVAIVVGLLLNVAGVRLPPEVWRPVDMLGATAVPLMLLAFGVSLRLDPLPGRGAHQAQAWVVVALKTVLHPLAAYLIGLSLGLTGPALYAVVVLGALPTAQNVHVIATRYARSELLARDAVFWTTILSVGTLLVIAALLG